MANKTSVAQSLVDQSASETVEGQLCSAQRIGKAQWQLAVETPVALRINDEDYAVMLCTPRDLVDFTYGFLISEAVVPSAQAVRQLHIGEADNGIVIDVDISASALAKQRLQERRLAGRSGCGACGIRSLQETLRPLPQVGKHLPIAPAAIQRAFNKLPHYQPIKSCNYSVHGAAWCDVHGNIVCVREDIGRHNALDKLIGRLAKDQTDLSNGFAILSSRCSYELVQKAASSGMRALATLSAPTTLALQLAEESGLQLSASCGDGIITFTPETPDK